MNAYPGPFKCPDCLEWWAGFVHRCREVVPRADTNVPWVVRPYTPPTSTGGSSTAPWCAICEGWHIPGAGPCTASYS